MEHQLGRKPPRSRDRVEMFATEAHCLVPSATQTSPTDLSPFKRRRDSPFPMRSREATCARGKFGVAKRASQGINCLLLGNVSAGGRKVS